VVVIGTTVRTILNRQRWNAGFSIITEANTNGGMRVSASASKNVRSIVGSRLLKIQDGIRHFIDDIEVASSPELKRTNYYLYRLDALNGVVYL